MKTQGKLCLKCLYTLGCSDMGFLWCENRKCKRYGVVVITYIPIEYAKKEGLDTPES